MLDLVVEGNAFYKGKLTKCCIGIKNGKIVEIKKILKGDRYYDFADRLILPAGIDVHVHFREPGLTHKEDFTTGSLSAAFGGISCVLDMPNNVPLVNSLVTFRNKLETVRKKSYVDFGLYGGISAQTNILELGRMCTGFKLFLVGTTSAIAYNQISKDLSEIFKEIAATEKLVAVHCEEEALFKKFEEKNLNDHLTARPNLSEESAIRKVIATAGNAKTHICHISAKESVELLKKNDRITAEVTPHHLLFNTQSNLGAFGKVNPPLRTKEDQFQLWTALLSGDIDIIASDHAPHTIDEKEQEFWKAPSGMPGVETTYPLMLNLAKKNKISTQKIVNAISEKPAEIFNLNKGKIELGYDADLAIVDMKRVVKIKADNLHSKCSWTPFEGFEAVFPECTILRGEFIIENNNLEAGKGVGKFVCLACDRA